MVALSRMSKKQTALLAFFTDLGISLWSYFKLTNYDDYLKTVKPYLSSPDFQVQIYQVMLQSLTFSLMIFLGFHAVIYWQYSKGKKWAAQYVRIYSLLALISCVFLIGMQTWSGFIPLILYGQVFLLSRKVVAEFKTVSAQ